MDWWKHNYIKSAVIGASVFAILYIFATAGFEISSIPDLSSYGNGEKVQLIVDSFVDNISNYVIALTVLLGCVGYYFALIISSVFGFFVLCFSILPPSAVVVVVLFIGLLLIEILSDRDIGEFSKMAIAALVALIGKEPADKKLKEWMAEYAKS